MERMLYLYQNTNQIQKFQRCEKISLIPVFILFFTGPSTNSIPMIATQLPALFISVSFFRLLFLLRTSHFFQYRKVYLNMVLIYTVYMFYNLLTTYWCYYILSDYQGRKYQHIVNSMMACLSVTAYFIIYIFVYRKRSNDPLEAIQKLDFLKTLSLW
jgi:hypothetical protein